MTFPSSTTTHQHIVQHNSIACCTSHCSKRENSQEKRKGKEAEIQGDLSWKLKIYAMYDIRCFHLSSPSEATLPLWAAFQDHSLVHRLPRSSRFQPQSSHKPRFITSTFCHNMNPLIQLKRCVSMIYSHVLSCSFLFSESLRSFRCPNAVLNVVWCSSSGFPVILLIE